MKIDFKQLNKRSTNSNVFIMTTGALACLVVAALLIGGLYFLLVYETNRLDDTAGADTKMPALDKDGINYFISRHNERLKISVPATPPPPTPSPVPAKKRSGF